MQIKSGDRDGLVVDHFERDGKDTVALERTVSSQQCVQNRAQGEEVRTPIDLTAIQLFRRHEGRRSQYLPADGQLAEIQFGNAKIGDLGMAVFGKQDI